MQSVHNPFTGQVLAELPLLEQGGVALLVERALKAEEVALPVDERMRILLHVAAQVEAGRDRFAQRIAEEGGKPLKDALVEVDRAADGLRLAAEGIAGALAGEEVPMGRTKASQGRTAYCLREPVGLVVAISAFNHPLNLIVHQVAPAVAVGCPVIVKPSMRTPLSCIALAELFYEAGLPEPWLQVALCDDAAAEALACDDRLRYLSFIGSAKVGWHLRRSVAAGVRVGLEHGGIAPVLLAPSADLGRALGPVVKGGMYHAGQVCVSTQRVFVPKARMDEVAEALLGQVKALVVGDPCDGATDVGPLIDAREVERVDRVIREALAGGAELLCGGEVLGQQCYAPTLLMHPSLQATVSQEELFGPAIMLYGYEGLDEAIARANHPRWSFSAAVFAEDREEIAQAVAGLDSAAVMVNESTAFRTDWMPFGGRRESGLGVGGIPCTLREYTQHKLVVEHRLG